MKKGFTLIELLATLTIILLIATLIVPNLLKMSEDVRQNQYNAQIELIESAAREYGEDHINELDDETCKNIIVDDLITSGYLKGESDNKTKIRDPRDKTKCLNNITVCIKYGKYGEVSQTSNIKDFYKVNITIEGESEICN